MHSNICWVLAEGFYAEETDVRKSDICIEFGQLKRLSFFDADF